MRDVYTVSSHRDYSLAKEKVRFLFIKVLEELKGTGSVPTLSDHWTSAKFLLISFASKTFRWC